MSPEELGHIRKVIVSIVNLYTKQQTNDGLSKRQNEMMTYFTEIETLLHETKLVNKASERTFTIWRLLYGDRALYEELEKRNILKWNYCNNDSKRIVQYALRIKNKEIVFWENANTWKKK